MSIAPWTPGSKGTWPVYRAVLSGLFLLADDGEHYRLLTRGDAGELNGILIRHDDRRAMAALASAICADTDSEISTLLGFVEVSPDEQEQDVRICATHEDGGEGSGVLWLPQALSSGLAVLLARLSTGADFGVVIAHLAAPSPRGPLGTTLHAPRAVGV